MSQFIEMFSKYPSETPWHKLLTIINGKVYPEEYNDIGTYPICGSAGVMYYGEKKLCDANTIILGRKGNINRPIYMESDYWIVDTAFCLDVNKSILHPKYFYYWCCQYDFTKLNKQGVLPSLTRKDLEKIEMSVPPMAEQKKFVSIAEQADKSKFGDFKSQFIEMFSKYPSETPWHKLLTIINGKVYPEEYNDIGTYPICGSAGVMYYGEKKLCDANTIILGRKGNINRPIYMESDYWIVDTAFCLDVNKSILHPKYFYYWCCQYDFTKLNKQGVLPSLTRKDLEKIEMSVPPMAEQKKFVSIAEQADKSKSYVRIALKNLESILGYCIRQVA